MSTSPLPVIEISPAPPVEPQPEPYSPFTPINSGFSSPVLDDTYRSSLLTPPVQSWSLSSRRQSRAQPKGMGLKEEEFQALLRSSKERSAAASTKKQDLRREVALKAHKNKQLERRALFLSKIGAPPSPTAISMPKTPPDSPAIFHYSLPSPGLCSPLALFEKLGLDDQDPEDRGARRVWVEQVDFRLPKRREPEPRHALLKTPTITVTTVDRPSHKGHGRKRSIPSLEEITERYSSQATAVPASPSPMKPRAPLPAFLNARRPSQPSVLVPEVKITAPEPTRPRLACTGRIRFPTRSPPPTLSKPLPALPLEPLSPVAPLPPSPRRRSNAIPSLPSSPRSPSPPSLQITITEVPRTESTSPVQLTEANLHALNSRTATARDMLSAIRRRTVISCGHLRPPSFGQERHAESSSTEDEKHRRRHSAPADLPNAQRIGFMHPVLALPGGF